MASERKRASNYDTIPENFWEGYMKGRPKVPDSFWDRIFEFHSSQGGKFGKINDLGSGPGVHASVLASKFKKVVLTDASPATIEAAQKRLSQRFDAHKFEYVEGTAEELDQVAGCDYDMVCACNIMHHTSPTEAIPAIVRALKPGGTFVAALFAFPQFDDDRVQNVSVQMFTHIIQRLAESLKEQGSDYKRRIHLQDSAYDAILLPPDLFQAGVKRIKINFHRPECFNMTPALKEEFPLISNFDSADERIRLDDSDWYFEFDLKEMQSIFATFPIRSDHAIMDRLWDEMSKLSTNGKYKGSWPVSIIMAKTLR